MYNIKLLGPGQASFNDKAIAGFPAQQHCLLFYYLLLNRRIPHTREQVAGIFWGDSSSQIARKNLRNTLWRLSQAFQSAGGALEDLVTVQEDCITFTGMEEYRVDIDEVEAAARCSIDHLSEELTPEQVAMLEAAVDLYKGEFLEGVYEDWCLYERERLRLAFLNILIKLEDYHSHKGNYARSLDYGKRILLLDPTREKIHRQIMMTHWLAGDREAALLQYHSCAKILNTELGLQPGPETQHLYETILRGSPSPARRANKLMEDVNSRADLSSDPPLKEMLQKLHFLEQIVEQTNTELHLLERMIHRVLEAK
ncbi:MAG TPA: BTAD domain-containing putative transcriptional regulator [Anaerolineales bacterium]